VLGVQYVQRLAYFIQIGRGAIDMSKKINPSDNHANQQNPNKGTPGTNRQHDQAAGNRGKQMNPNQQGGKKGK